MNCHRCKWLTYCGEWRGRCTHPNHQDVSFARPKPSGSSKSSRSSCRRKPNWDVCPDFSLIQKCRECVKWMPGGYYKDSSTPSVRGECYEGHVRVKGHDCPYFKENNIANRIAFMNAIRSGKESPDEST